MDHFVIEDLLNFPNDDNLDGGLTDSSTTTPVNTSCNSSADAYFQGGPGGVGDGHFTNELCVPYDDLAELEWVSSFVDESFSSDDLHLLEGMKARNNEVPQAHQYEFQPESSRSGPMLSVPGKARSKRSRAAPGSWTSRVLMVQEVAGEGRRCLHCATEKTPQWRTGPMGPKTLCNACGVRYKSGRLVPEYRPAASPTFVLMKHSNSHRKVLELRRQKEMQQQQQFLHQHHHQQQSIMFDVSKSNDDDYLIHQHIQPGFRHLIQD